MNWKRLVALLAALALLAAACGSDDDGGDASGDADDGSSVEADDSSWEDDSGDEETDEAMEDESAPTGEAGQGGPLLLLQWQAINFDNVVEHAGKNVNGLVETFPVETGIISERIENETSQVY